jgi:hypothetical protein
MNGWKRKAEASGIALFRSQTDRPHPFDPAHPVKEWLDPVPGLPQRTVWKAEPAAECR